MRSRLLVCVAVIVVPFGYASAQPNTIDSIRTPLTSSLTEYWTDNQRQVIAMRDIQGCSSEEVCSTLGISRGNQRVQLHRARASVGRELKRYLTPAALPAPQGI